jgi:hypothetical protein
MNCSCVIPRMVGRWLTLTFFVKEGIGAADFERLLKESVDGKDFMATARLGTTKAAVR